MAEVNNRPAALSIFQRQDLNAGIFGSYDAGAKTEQGLAVYQTVLWGTFAEEYIVAGVVNGLIPPSFYTTELYGVVAVTNSGTQADIAALQSAGGSIGAVMKRGYVMCRMDTANPPVVGQAVSVNLNAGLVGYVTGKVSGGVLNIAKEQARVKAVFDTHCEVELTGEAVMNCTYVA